MTNPNKSAFPVVTPDNTIYDSGMTLRDYFAGQFMAINLQKGYDTLTAAASAYRAADAMLKQRDVK